MQKTMLYLPWRIKAKIKTLAENKGVSQAEIMRMALELGLEQVRSRKDSSVESLLELSKLGQKYQPEKVGKTQALQEIDKIWQDWDQ